MFDVLGCVSPEQSGATGEDWGQAWARTPAPCPGATTPPPPLTLALMLYFYDLNTAGNTSNFSKTEKCLPLEVV